MYTIRPVIDLPWTHLPPRRIGAAPRGLAPRLRIDLYSQSVLYFSSDARVLDTAI
jgi:hypothetical protein